MTRALKGNQAGQFLSMSDVLRVDNIRKHYGGVAALVGASFSLRAGEVHALMGENGAGKSTLAKILAGSEQPDNGKIWFNGEPTAIASPLHAQQLGISIIYQELDLFPHLTVAENIVIGNREFECRKLVNFHALDRFCEPLLKQVALSCSPRRTLGSLSIGQMQLVAIARSLSLNARVILMDEPTSALFEDGVQALFRIIAALKERGVAVVYVSHKMDEILRICDRATVLRDGSTIGTREIASTNAEELISLMVGRELQSGKAAIRAAAGEVVLSVSRLTTDKLRDVSFDLRKGEVLGVAGLVGAGRSELGAALFGLDPWNAGQVYLNGTSVEIRSPRDAIALGIGLLPEDRKLQGLMMQMSILENSTLPVVSRLQSLGFVRRHRERAAAHAVFEKLSFKARSYQMPVSVLSGGNQQKVMLAKCLLPDPLVLFMDDPARGIDIGAKQDIYRIIADLAVRGKSIILVSSELPELLHCCDRIMVLREGRVTAIFDAAGATQEGIMAAATIPAGHTGPSAT